MLTLNNMPSSKKKEGGGRMGAKAKINDSLCKGEYCTFIKAFDTIASFISSSASFPILSLVSRLKFISKKQKQLDKKFLP